MTERRVFHNRPFVERDGNPAEFLRTYINVNRFRTSWKIVRGKEHNASKLEQCRKWESAFRAESGRAANGLRRLCRKFRGGFGVPLILFLDPVRAAPDGLRLDGTRPRTRVRATIEEWRDQFLKDGEARSLSHATLRLYKLLFRQVLAFTQNRGIKFVNDLDLDAVTEFRAGWKVGALTASKRLERLRGVFKFALQRKLVEENHAVNLVGPKLKQNPTLPFSKDDMAKILKAAESDEVDERVEAFILTMRIPVYASLT
jgi:hypothetical protein